MRLLNGKRFKKFLKYRDGFEKNDYLRLYKEWKKIENFDDWCDEPTMYVLVKRHGNNGKNLKSLKLK